MNNLLAYSNDAPRAFCTRCGQSVDIDNPVHDCKPQEVVSITDEGGATLHIINPPGKRNLDSFPREMAFLAKGWRE